MSEPPRWALLTNLLGSQGPSGLPGSPGQPGGIGPAGPTGPTGPSGGGQFTAFTTPPLAVNWSWSNQPTGTTLADTAAGLCLKTTGWGTGEDTALIVKSIPSAPYTITAGMLFYGEYTSSSYNSVAAGIAVKSSGGNGIKMLQNRVDSNLLPLTNVRYNSAHNTGTTDLYNVGACRIIPVLWLQIKDDNTTRTYSTSPDGINWFVVYSEARATTFTPDQIGLNLWGTGRSSNIVSTIVSYQETQP